MTSIFYLEKNGQKYAYESKSVRVPGRKNPKTIKTYLGKVDPETGNIIPKKTNQISEVEYVKHYGAVQFLNCLQKDMGILEDLQATFPTMASDIMGAAISLTINPNVMNSLQHVVEDTTVKEMLNLKDSLPLPTLDKLTTELGKMTDAIDLFFKKRISRCSGRFYAIDSTTVYVNSTIQSWSQWGHNNTDVDLQRNNLCIVTDEKGIPVMFRQLPGDIGDQTVLNNIIDDLNSLGIDYRFVLDKLHDNPETINSILNMDGKFTLMSDASSEPIKKLLTRSIQDMKDAPATLHENNMYQFVEYDVGITYSNNALQYMVKIKDHQKNATEKNRLFDQSNKIKAFVVYDPLKASDDIHRLMDRVHDMQTILDGSKPADPHAAYIEFPALIRRYLDYTVDDEGTIHTVRKDNAFTFANNRSGRFVMLSSKDTTFEDMMASYDIRNWVSRTFDHYRYDFYRDSYDSKLPERTRGRLFIRCISLMLRIQIQNILRDHDMGIKKFNKDLDSIFNLNVDGAIISLNSVSVIGSPGHWRISTVPDNVLELFRLFGFEEPRSGQIILPDS